MADATEVGEPTETDKLNASIESTNSSEQIQPHNRIPIHQIIGSASPQTKMYFLLGTLSSWVMGSLVPVLFYLVGQMFDEMTDEEEDDYDYSHEVNKITIIELGVGLLALLSGYLSSFFFVRVGQGIGREKRQEYFGAILHKDVKYYDVNSKSAMQVPSDMAKCCDAMEQGTGEKFMAFMEVLMYVIVGFGMCIEKSPQLFLVSLSLAPLDFIGSALIGKAIVENIMLSHAAYVNAGAISEEALMDIKTVASYNAQAYVSDNYNKELDGPVKFTMKNRVVEGLGWGIMWGTWFLMGTLVFWVSAKWVSDENRNWIWMDDFEGPDAIVIFWVMAYTCNILGNIVPGLMSVADAEVCAYKANEFIGANIDFVDGNDERPIEGHIRFDNVRFAYPSKADTQVLKGLSFEFEAQKSYAIVGESGAGKSTIIQLIERFYEPTSGTVYIDNCPLTFYKVASLRKQIGYVNQEPILFNLTIGENIKLGNPDATQPEIEDAARRANCYDFIMKMEGQFDASVGLKGSQISGGQKQRIAIARAIIKHPKILLLDEATSALDNISEAIVLKAVKNITTDEKMTVVSVAQKLSTIRNVDQIVVLENGQCSQVGSHNELITQEGCYANMCRAQGISLDEAMREGEAEKKMIEIADQPAPVNEEQPPAPAKVSDLPFLRILRMSLDYWPLLAVGVIGAVIAGACFPIFGYLIGKDTYYILGRSGDEMEDNIRKFSLIILALAAVIFIGFFMMCWGFGVLTAYTTKDIRRQSFYKLLHYEADFFDKKENNASMLSQNLSRDTELLNTAGGPLLGVFLMIIVALVIGCAISMIWQLYIGLLIMACIPLMMFAMIRGYMLHMTGISHPQHQAAQSMVLDSVVNLKMVKAYGMEERLETKHNELLENAYNSTAWESHENGFYFGLGLMILYDVYAAAFWLGAVLQAKDKAGYEDICVAIYASMMASVGIFIAAVFAPGVSEGSRAAKRIFEIIDYEPKINALDTSGDSTSTIMGPVEFQHVSFKYASRENLVLDNVDFKVDAGHTLGITGTSGSGKTTIVQLLLRFYDVTEGAVLIGGKDIRTLSLHHLRRHIATVSQEPVLFSGTLRHNVVFGLKNEDDTDMSDADVMTALKLAKVPFTDLDMDVGVRGSQVSGGQKQRIAIARAVLRNPTIMVMDEATSALDSRTERDIMKTLEEVGKGRTVLLVAHRLSTIKRCDQIMVLETGKIVEKGTHDELVKQKGHYAKLWAAATNAGLEK